MKAAEASDSESEEESAEGDSEDDSADESEDHGANVKESGEAEAVKVSSVLVIACAELSN